MRLLDLRQRAGFITHSTANSVLGVGFFGHVSRQRAMRRGLGGTCSAVVCVMGKETKFREPEPFIMGSESA